MHFERYSDPILPFQLWLRRVFGSLSIAAFLVGISLFIGVMGYHTLGKLNWVDSILEACMILGGMGPVSPLANDAVKLFASAYALFSGLMLIGITGVLLGPWVHRLLHFLHAGEARKPKLSKRAEAASARRKMH